MGRKKQNHIILTDDDVTYLKRIMKKKSTTQTLFSRCQILISLDENHSPALTYDQCIEVYSVSCATIAKVVSLFAAGGIAAVLKTNRSINSNNANRKVNGRVEAKIIEIVCSPVPNGHRRWTIQPFPLFVWMKSHISFLVKHRIHGQCVPVITKKLIMSMLGMEYVVFLPSLKHLQLNIM